jgi:hypothetical protein
MKSEEFQLEEPLHFYNGSVTLRFDRANWHWYIEHPDGRLERVSGITGVVGIIDKSLYLVPWACKMMYLKMLRLIPTEDNRIKSITLGEFDALLTQSKTAHKDKFEEAGDVGTAAHKWIEATIRNAITFNHGVVDKMNDMAPTDERSISCGMAAFDWMQKHNVRFLCTERVVYSRKHGYAGTTDGLALVDACENPACCGRLFLDELDLVDWKSSNSLRIDYLYQTAAYQNAIIEDTGEDIKARWILRLDKETGKFEAWYELNFEQDFAGYLACLALQRVHRAVEQRMSDQKKLKTFKKREAVKEVKEKIKFAKRTEREQGKFGF